MANRARGISRLDVKRREQTPQALARLVVVALFVGLWFVLWLARMPMPVPFLCVLLAEISFFLVYWRTVFLLRSVRAIEVAHYGMLAAEIVFHTTIVYFLGGISWLGSFAYVFGLIFTNTFLDLRRGLVYTSGASLAFGALILLDATGAIPHYVFLEQGARRYSDPTFVATTLVGAGGVFFSIYLWVNWVGRQLRVERDAAVRAQDGLLAARAELERANEALEARVLARTGELERANAALKESEERFRRISENAPDVIYRYRLRPTFTCEYISPASLTITGYAPAEYYVDPMLGLTTVHPDDRDLLQDAFLGGTDEPLTVRCIRKDGEVIWAEQRFVAIYDLEGHVTAIEGIARDVTERRRAEEALRDSEQRLNLVVETSPDLIAIQARNGRYTFVNSAYRTVLGYEPDALTGVNPADFIHADDLDDVSKRFNEMVRSGRPGEATFRFRHHDGHWVTLEANGQVLVDEDGQPTGVVVVSRDVTERVRAAEAVRHSEDVLRATIESTADAIVVFDDHGRMLHCNSRFADMWGLTQDLLQTREGRALAAYITDQLEDPDAFLESTRQIYATADESTDVLVLKDGRVFDRFTRPLFQDDQTVGRVWSFRDVTERLRAVQALRESEEVLRATIESTGDGILVVGQDGGVAHANARFMEMWRIPLELFAIRDDDRLLAFVLDQLVDPDAFLAKVRELYQSADESFDTLRFRDGRVFDRFSRPLVTNGEVVGRVWSFRDVTERRHAEEALRESEERFRSLAENMFDLICETTPDGRFSYLSPNFQEVLGYTPEELLGAGIFERVHPDDRPAVAKEFARILDSRTVGMAVFRHQHKNGEWRWFESTGRAFETASGELRAVIISRDITERKHQEQTLEALRRHNALILNSAGEGIFGLNLEGRTTFVNPTASKLLGWPADELIDQRQHDVIHHTRHDGTPYPAEQCPIYAALRDGRVHHVADEVFWRRDGTSFPVEYLSTPIRDERGEIVGAVVTFRDITERRRQEEALRESESKFRTMAETVAAAAFIFQGDKMRYVNSAAESITGYSRDELLQMNFWDVIHPDHRDLVHERGLARQHGQHAPPRYEVKLLTKSGLERWVDFTAGIIEFDGAPAVLGTAFDITERKRAEDALREQARRDPLTGLLNHAAIVDELRELIARGGQDSVHAVAMVDVDGLKAVNDTFGHQIGDLVLLTVARALTREGAVVGRYGGDEFVALLKSRDRAGAERYRDGVVEAVTGVRLKDPATGATVPVVVSMGLAVYPEEAESIEELIKLSDSAMYAWRRHRSILPGDPRPSGPLPGARAAEMIGELVPLLTSPGDLSDKFRAVAHRLSVGAGYDAVNFALFADQPGPPLAANTFARVADELVEAWNDDQRADLEEPHPIRLYFQRNPLPVIIDDPWNDQRLLESQRSLLRAAGFRSVLVAPMLWHGKVVGSLGVASQQEHAFSSRDAQFLAAVATQLTAIVRMATLVEELQGSAARLSDAQTETVMLLASVAEARDQTTGRHLQNVRALTEALAREIGYDEDPARELGLAAVLHDIGKIRVPDAVLGNTDPLSPDQWELIKQHTLWGAELLSGHPGFELAATIARCHHERWDGAGYPAGITGDQLPEAAAIVAVADAFDAIVHSRPYSKGRSAAHAVREIASCAGKQFSPQVVEALLRLHAEQRLPATTRPRRAA